MSATNTLVFARRAGKTEIEQNPQHDLPGDKYYVVGLDMNTAPPTIITCTNELNSVHSLFFALGGIIVPENLPRLVIDGRGNIVNFLSGDIIMKGPSS